MERKFANPDKHTHNLLRRGAFVSNDNATDLVFFYKRRQIRILPEDRDIGKLFRQNLITFIDKANNTLTASRSLGKVFSNLSTGLRRPKNENVIRPISLTKQRPQEDIDEHTE